MAAAVCVIQRWNVRFETESLSTAILNGGHATTPGAQHQPCWRHEYTPLLQEMFREN